MLLAATMAIWVSFLVVAAVAAAVVVVSPEPTATKPGGPGRPVVLVPTDLLTFSTLVVRIRLAPLATVLVLLLLVLVLASEWAGCKRFSLLTGVTEMVPAAAAATKAVFDCVLDCDWWDAGGVLTAGGLLLGLLLVAVLELLLDWIVLLLVALVLLLVFHGHWWGWYCCLIVRLLPCVCGAIFALMEAVLRVVTFGVLAKLLSFLLILMPLLLRTVSDGCCIELPALT